LRLWDRWKSRTAETGRDPGYFAKALLIVAAALGHSQHFNDNREHLLYGAGGGLRAVFEWIEASAAAVAGRRPQPFAHKSYQKALAQIGKLVDPLRNRSALRTDHFVATNIEL